MLRSWKIGQAFGIPVYVHSSFLLAPLLILMLHQGGGGIAGGIFLVAMCLAVFACVILHEFGHALMARYFGYGTRDITIYPIGGVARLEGMSEQPHEEILIAVAGPAVNVVIAALLTPIVVLAFMSGVVTPDPLQVALGGGAWAVLGHFSLGLWASNIALVLFNMIPAFPMDGGRVLRALLSMGLGFPRGTEVAARIGTVMAFGLGILGLVLGNYMLPFLALFVALVGQQELLVVRRREAMKQVQQQAIPSHFAASSLPPFYEPAPVGRAVEVAAAPTAEPNPSAEPKLLFHFRVIEIPEPPR